jgi:hypothetical protein
MGEGHPRVEGRAGVPQSMHSRQRVSAAAYARADSSIKQMTMLRLGFVVAVTDGRVDDALD